MTNAPATGKGSHPGVVASRTKLKPAWEEGTSFLIASSAARRALARSADSKILAFRDGDGAVGGRDRAKASVSSAALREQRRPCLGHFAVQHAEGIERSQFRDPGRVFLHRDAESLHFIGHNIMTGTSIQHAV